MKLADAFVWMPEGISPFLTGKIIPAIDRPPCTAALAGHFHPHAGREPGIGGRPWGAYRKTLRDRGNRLPGFQKEVSGALHRNADCPLGFLK